MLNAPSHGTSRNTPRTALRSAWDRSSTNGILNPSAKPRSTRQSRRLRSPMIPPTAERGDHPLDGDLQTHNHRPALERQTVERHHLGCSSQLTARQVALRLTGCAPTTRDTEDFDVDHSPAHTWSATGSCTRRHRRGDTTASIRLQHDPAQQIEIGELLVAREGVPRVPPSAVRAPSGPPRAPPPSLTKASSRPPPWPDHDRVRVMVALWGRRPSRPSPRPARPLPPHAQRQQPLLLCCYISNEEADAPTRQPSSG